MGNIIVKAFLSYIEKHPEVVEQLIEKLIHEILNHGAGSADKA